MKDAHAADLVWRFQYGEDLVREAPSAFGALAEGASSEGTSAPLAEERLEARDRAARIDAALKRLPTKPLSLARVLCLRYGPAEIDRHTKNVLRELALVAAFTPEAARCATELTGRAPRHRSHDVRAWLAGVCERIEKREFTGEEYIALNEVHDAAESLMAVAEDAYEASAERRSGISGRKAESARRIVRKVFYKGPEIADALGISRWSVQRWLDVKQVPYDLHRREGASRGGRIVVMRTDLRTFAPSYFASVREAARTV